LSLRIAEYQLLMPDGGEPTETPHKSPLQSLISLQGNIIHLSIFNSTRQKTQAILIEFQIRLHSHTRGTAIQSITKKTGITRIFTDIDAEIHSNPWTFLKS
jgi:hypothetical protein